MLLDEPEGEGHTYTEKRLERQRFDGGESFPGWY
jgi:hypothetical protein